MNMVSDSLLRSISILSCLVLSLVGVFIVREAEVILPTFSREKSILLLNCPLDA